MESSAVTPKKNLPFLPFGMYEVVSSLVLFGPWVLFGVLLFTDTPVQPQNFREFVLDVGLIVMMYVITAPGITIGFHRYLTHRSFKTSRALRVLLAVMGSMAVEGPPITWVANHNKHHVHADEEGDPHSPHVGHHNIWAGFGWAHLFWMIKTPTAQKRRFARELINDPDISRVNGLFPLIALASIVLIPFAIGWSWTWDLDGALRAIFWGGLVRMVMVHNITWSVNSFCHTVGIRKFKTRSGREDHSTNVSWLAGPTLGEANHNNHHAFPRSAVHGLNGESDISGALIRFMERWQLVWDVVEPSPEEINERLITT
jgi:stearoyl-CoA desaturase (delta-9 desaturase)